jgi:hypothetical protein
MFERSVIQDVISRARRTAPGSFSIGRPPSCGEEKPPYQTTFGKKDNPLIFVSADDLFDAEPPWLKRAWVQASILCQQKARVLLLVTDEVPESAPVE